VRRGRIKAKRDTPRRRATPQWDEHAWTHAIYVLNKRCGGRCECCGKPLNNRAERHHRIRRRDGGDRLSNLLTLLPECHHYWTEHPAEARDRGIIVRSEVRFPSTVPVLWQGRRLVLLDDEGGWTLVPGEDDEGCQGCASQAMAMRVNTDVDHPEHTCGSTGVGPAAP
jgi:hypothetical protein